MMLEIKRKMNQLWLYCKKILKQIWEQIRKFYYRYQEKIHKIGFISIFVFSVFFVIHLYRTDIYYYAHKDTGKVFSERVYVNVLPTESKIQASIRTYLSGSQHYYGRVPFIKGNSPRLISTSYNMQDGVLILNWDAYLYTQVQKKSFSQDLENLIKVIKKNFPVKIVYFMVEGVPSEHIFYKNSDLGKGLII